MQRAPRSRASSEYQFQRAYKACIPCRRRKVKCEFDPEPHHHACKRCRKMDLECRFTAKQPWSRRKTEQVDDQSTGRSEKQADGISTSVLQKQVSSGNDALDILFDAAAAARGNHQGHASPAASRATKSSRPESGFDDSQNDVRRVWSSCRFVKMGWFTADEAVLYMDWFFRNLAPVTPILTSFFASHHTHYWLITQEPVLCCTILMISARYHTLPGPCGVSRGFYIHQRLWQHCQHLILRIMLGQEKLSKAKTRHLGTIEALLLLSEWYPLALHFPHETDGWDSDLMLTAPNMRDPPRATQETPMQDRWREDVVEPTKRSDRMSWMLVSSALALAHELGVFDSKYFQGVSKDLIVGPNTDSYLEALELRRQRLPSLLFVIVNLLSSRIGCTSIMPDNHKQSDLSGLLLVDPEWADFMTAWVDLTRLTRTLRDMFFSSTKSDGRQCVDLESLELWKAQLSAWRDHRQRVENSHYDNILQIEYQYLRVFANSLGVQGIVERALSSTLPQGTIDVTFVWHARQINMSRNEYELIEEVIDGACAILARVVSLSHPKPLQCLPLRVLSRMISSSIFLLKALALGVRKAKLQESLHMLDSAIAALQSNQLDDIHLASRYAALLKIHVSRLRQTFASSGEVEGQNDRPSDTDVRDANASAQLAHAETTWDASTIDWSNQGNDLGDWLSLPLDPLMAPFGSWDGGQTEFGLDSDCLDLDFIWNLPP